MPLILPANTLADTGYNIDNSIRINDADNAYLSWTPGSDGDLDKWTLSMWVKRTTISTYDYTFTVEKPSAGDNTVIVFYSDDGVRFEHYDGSQLGMLTTNRKLRDPNAWYHIVFVWDTNNVTSGDRMILYVNGVRETSFSTETYPGSGQDSLWNSAMQNTIGEKGSAGYFDGSMSHIHFCDGYAYAASDFGQTDSTSGIWKIKTSPSVSYGTNGFFLKMEDRTNLDLDSSPNAHTFTTGGTLTATYDNPSNNFCTMNPLNRMGGSSPTWANGNTTYTQGGTSQYFPAAGTMGLSAGLWYFEGLYTSGNAAFIGIAGDASIATNMAGTVNNYLGW